MDKRGHNYLLDAARNGQSRTTRAEIFVMGICVIGVILLGVLG